MKQRTFIMLKPDAVKRGLVGRILSRFEDRGFAISAIRMTALSKEEAGRLYDVHRGKSFMETLIEYVTSGPVVAVLLDGEDAVEVVRRLCGKTDPREADLGSIRGAYGINLTVNTIHAADSVENARRESSIFFPDYS